MSDEVDAPQYIDPNQGGWSLPAFSGQGAGQGAGVGGAIGGGIGDIIGYFLSQGDRDTARKLLQQASSGTAALDPNVQAALQGPSAYNSADPQTREDQMAALDQLHTVWSNQGLDPIAKAQIAQANLQSQGSANAMNNGLEGMAAQRGMLDSGSLMAAQRSNAQAAANTGAMASTQAAAGGEQRAMGALGQYMGGATDVRGQDYQKAQAQDAINRFNAANETATRQQDYQNALEKNNQLAGYGGDYRSMAGDTMRMAQGAGQGLGAGAGAVVGGLKQGADVAAASGM